MLRPSWVPLASFAIVAARCLALAVGAHAPRPASRWSPLDREWRSQYGQDRFVFERFFAADELASSLSSEGGGEVSERRWGVFVELETHDYRKNSRAGRMERLLRRNGFRFFDRVVQDDIWIRRRSNDLGCHHPGLRFTAEASPWGAMREAAHWALEDLRAVLPLAQRGSRTGEVLGQHRAAFQKMQELWVGGDPRQLEAECPMGVLAASMHFNLLERIHGNIASVGADLRVQQTFHQPLRVHRMAGALNFTEEVLLAERAGHQLEIRLPLPRSWHEASFIETLESGWPLFGYLDFAARAASAQGQPIFADKTAGFNILEPMAIPRPMCQLEVAAGGMLAHLKIQPKPQSSRGPHAARADFFLDADACSKLGMAAARFHAARALLRAAPLAPRLDRYVKMVNWTVPEGCIGAMRLDSTSPDRHCSTLPHADCAAVDDRGRAVPRRCLAVRRAAGRALRLRRGPLLEGTQAGNFIQEGERLLREFIDRHGLFNAVWATSTAELAPAVEGEPQRRPVWGGDGPGETAFAVLQSLQDLLLRFEGLG